MKRHLAFLLSLFLSAGTALAQTGETINQLSPGAALAGTEQIPMYQAANPAVTTTPSAVASYAVGSQRNNLHDWVNIKDPQFGATGNGSTDDTAAIQAAIDYTFAHNLTAVYCPAGTYKVSNTLFLDPPANMRTVTWSGTGYFTASGNVFTVVSTTTGSLANGDYVLGSNYTAGPVRIVAGSGSPWTINDSFSQGSSGSPISLSAFNPTDTPLYSYQMSFFGDPSNNAYFPGCKLNFTFNNAPAFLVGTGQGMHVADISVNGPGGGYRCAQSPYGIGIGTSGGGGGSHVNLIEDTAVANFYYLWRTDANDIYGNTALNDSNTWRNPNGYNGCYGIQLQGTQSFIDDIVEPTINTTTYAVSSPASHQVNVFGGNLSAVSSVGSSFAISATSGINSCASYGVFSGPAFCFNTTIASPDQYVNTVYNSYMLLTPHFGVVPMTLATWNPSTGVAVFGLWNPWLFGNFGSTVPGFVFYTPFSAELEAATTLYATERVEVAVGSGIVLEGQHIENFSACTTLFDGTESWGGQVSNEIRDPYFNNDISLSLQQPTYAIYLPQIYCQQSFPYVYMEGITNGGAPQEVRLTGGNWNAAANPIIFDFAPISDLSGSQLGTNAGLNLRVYDNGTSYFQSGTPLGAFANPARGGGRWDHAYFRPAAAITPGALFDNLLAAGEIEADFCGFEPCPSSTPNIGAIFGMVSNGGLITGRIDSGTPGIAGTVLTVSAVSGSVVIGPGNVITGGGTSVGTTISYQISGATGGIGTYSVNNSQSVGSASLTASLGALGTYPPIACRTVFKSVDWNTPAVTPPSTAGGGIFKRSASCPGYSYGQNLTTTTLGATTNAIVTGTISNGSGGSGNILNVTAVTSGTLSVGDSLSGAGVPTGEHIIQQSSGTSAGAGHYLVSESANSASETLTDPVAAWAYEAGSDVLYLDAKTMKWMFPGLGISIDNGSGAQPYIVTGVYQYLGYVTVTWAANNVGGPLQGSGINACTSGCTIGQASFAWTAY